MELGKQLSSKLFLNLLIFGLLFEGTLIFLIFVRFRNPLNSSLDEIIELTESKIISLNEKLNRNSNTLIYKYISDLKLITTHIIHYQKASNNSNKKFFNNYLEKKKWYPTDDYNYPNETNKNRYYDDQLKEFNYIDILEEKFKNNYNHNDIINSLFKESEFNIIGIYNYTNEVIKESEIKLSYYFISILKSIFIRRYILKRNDIDYLRFILTQNNCSFIYPYDRSHKSKTIILFKEKISLLHEYNSNKCKSYSLSLNTNYITFYSYFNDDNIIFCLVQFGPNNQTTSDKSQTLCLEIESSKFLKGILWEKQTEIDLSIVLLNNSEIQPIYHENSDYYRTMKETFNGDKYDKYNFSSRIKLFHILYYRLFSKYPNLNFTKEFFEDIKNEYQIIKQEVLDKINNIEESYCNNNNEEIECQKDTSKIIIYPFLIETMQLDNLYNLDIEGTSIKYPIFYSISIIESNKNITKHNIFKIMDNKTIKLFFFFITTLVITIIFIWLLMEIINNILLSSIYKIKDGLKAFDEMVEGSQTIDINKILKYENKILTSNKEMKILNEMSNNIKKMIIIQIVMNNKNGNNNMYLNNSRLCNIILKMKNSTIKEICLIILGYHHFKKRLYLISENEFNLVLNNIINKEKNINIENDNTDQELKETIKRFNDITYLNDNSILKGINETILPNIKIKFAKQKIIYLQ